MPLLFFERCGFSKIKSHQVTAEGNKEYLDKEAILCKPPEFLGQNYQFKPIAGKVIVDLCWHTFCQICDIGAQWVQEVCKDFGIWCL